MIESFNYLEKEDKIEVIFREPNNSVLCTDPPQQSPDYVWKEIYGIEEGKLKMIDRIQGKHTPGKYVPDEISFS